MIQETCLYCKDAGFTNVIAHYKAVPAGMSHTGRAIPPLCYEHKNGNTPKFILDKQQAELKKKEATFDGQNGPEPLNFDKQEAVKLYESGMSWGQVASKLGISYHRVYQTCRKLVKAKPQKPGKWSGTFEPLEPLAIGESLTVSLPEGGTRATMNSMISLHSVTKLYKWSLHDNLDGTITVTKVGKWPTLAEYAQKLDQENEKEPIEEAEPEVKIEEELTPFKQPPPLQVSRVEVVAIEKEPVKKSKLTIHKYDRNMTLEIEDISLDEVIELLGVVQALT